MSCEIKTIILLSMLFLHIVDDYYLQGILAQMKQRTWWFNNYPDKKYEDDYIMALMEHAFSWSFMVHIPVGIAVIYMNGSFSHLFFLFFVNWIIHAVIDNLKVNYLDLNLAQDQMIHITQIVITWTILMFK